MTMAGGSSSVLAAAGTPDESSAATTAAAAAAAARSDSVDSFNDAAIISSIPSESWLLDRSLRLNAPAAPATGGGGGGGGGGARWGDRKCAGLLGGGRIVRATGFSAWSPLSKGPICSAPGCGMVPPQVLQQTPPPPPAAGLRRDDALLCRAIGLVTVSNAATCTSAATCDRSATCIACAVPCTTSDSATDSRTLLHATCG